jgi:hypothetical protein
MELHRKRSICRRKSSTFGFMHLTYPTKRRNGASCRTEYVRGHVDGYLKCEQDQTRGEVVGALMHIYLFLIIPAVFYLLLWRMTND